KGQIAELSAARRLYQPAHIGAVAVEFADGWRGPEVDLVPVETLSQAPECRLEQHRVSQAVGADHRNGRLRSKQGTGDSSGQPPGIEHRLTDPAAGSIGPAEQVEGPLVV